MVRKGGFEPPRSCERQPLKLVRLPVPPLSQSVTKNLEPASALLRGGSGDTRDVCRHRFNRLHKSVEVEE